MFHRSSRPSSVTPGRRAPRHGAAGRPGASGPATPTLGRREREARPSPIRARGVRRVRRRSRPAGRRAGDGVAGGRRGAQAARPVARRPALAGGRAVVGDVRRREGRRPAALAHGRPGRGRVVGVARARRPPRAALGGDHRRRRALPPGAGGRRAAVGAARRPHGPVGARGPRGVGRGDRGRPRGRAGRRSTARPAPARAGREPARARGPERQRAPRPALPPAVIDFSPYWRPGGVRLGRRAVDAVAWHGAAWSCCRGRRPAAAASSSWSGRSCSGSWPRRTPAAAAAAFGPAVAHVARL
jgi:hypothetical protein